MKNKSVTIFRDLHARPATLLIQKTQQFQNTTVWIEKDGKKIQLNSLIALLSLGLKKDSVIHIKTEGQCEESALESLASFIEKGCCEDG